jgi:tetratricopeptide (TPR) repeat protein
MIRFSIFLLLVIIFFVSCSKKTSKVTVNKQSGAEELLAYGDKVYNTGDYESAFLAYGVIYKEYPTSREYIDATIGLSRCYGQLQNHEKEFELLYNLLRENIIPSKVPQVYNAIAEFYENSAGISEQLTGDATQDYKTAIGYYEKAIKYQNSEDEKAKGYAQYKIGELYENLGEFERSLEAYEKTVTNYQGVDWDLLASEKISIIQTKREAQILYEQSLSPTQGDTMNQSESANANIEPVTIDTMAVDTAEVVPQKSDQPKETENPEEKKESAPAETPADYSGDEKPELD